MKYTNSTNQHINDNNYVNLHDVTNLGLYNKFILVTQKQVLEFYIIAIERKTLNGLTVHHTAYSKYITTTTKATMNTTTRVHVTKAVIGTQHKISGEVPDIRFLSNHTRKQMKVMEERKEDLTTLKFITKDNYLVLYNFHLFYILRDKLV